MRVVTLTRAPGRDRLRIVGPAWPGITHITHALAVYLVVLGYLVGDVSRVVVGLIEIVVGASDDTSHLVSHQNPLCITSVLEAAGACMVRGALQVAIYVVRG